MYPEPCNSKGQCTDNQREQKADLLEFWRNTLQLLIDVFEFVLDTRDTEFASSLS